MMRVAPDKVVLNLTLTAAADNDDISFPLDVGEVMARVTFTDDDADDGDTFVDAFTDYVTVFMIRPAQCELLFPVVTVMPMESGGLGHGNLRHQPGVYGREGCRRADFHLLPDDGRTCGV